MRRDNETVHVLDFRSTPGDSKGDLGLADLRQYGGDLFRPTRGLHPQRSLPVSIMYIKRHLAQSITLKIGRVRFD